METNEIPKPRVSPPDLDNLPEYIKANQDHIRLDESYNHLSPTEALNQMGIQAQKVVTDFRKLGRPDQKIQKLVADYLIGPVNEEPASKHK